MSKRWLVLACGLGAAAAFLAPHAGSAHELLPKPLQDYIQAHPNASVEDIQSFIEKQDEQVRSLYRTKEDVIRILKNKNVGFWDNVLDFIKLGVGHILSGPDHILFVLSLLLVFITWREILQLTLTFTLAHSITLVLAGAGILVLASKYVEPMIALSIAYVAITSVFFKDHYIFSRQRNKLGTVFFFGLFHGLGFAGLLKEINIPSDRFISSLVSFNFGIEIGQLIIVSAAFPFIYFARKKAWYPRAIKIVGGAIGAIGLFWAIQRISLFFFS